MMNPVIGAAETITELKAQLETAQGILEDIKLNLEGDLDRLPAHILSYKLKRIKRLAQIGAGQKGGE